jgi:hypothetical protein
MKAASPLDGIFTISWPSFPYHLTNDFDKPVAGWLKEGKYYYYYSYTAMP